MSPEDPRHGTNAGYIHHHLSGHPACQQCRAAHADYRRSLRTRRYLSGGPLMIDGAGTRRRLQALVALGYTLQEISRELGHTKTWASQLLRHSPTGIRRSTAAQVATVYDAWGMTPATGPWAERQRHLAAGRGWLPPLAWDDIDDPTERPRHSRARRDDIDEVAVAEVLAGRVVRCTRAERVEVTRRWAQAGRSLKTLGELTGWKVDRYLRLRDLQEAS